MNEKNKKIIIFTIITVVICIVGGIKIFQNSNDTRYEVSQTEKIEKEEGGDIKKEDNSKVNNTEVTVYISGAVKNSGVVTMTSEDRLSDAIKVVGGVVEGADMNMINLAEKLVDGKHYIIPKVGEQIPTDINANQTQSSSNRTNTSSQGSNSLVNINTATIEELDTLPGVGEATANKIINYREENGGFKNIEDIKNVKGIGDKKFEDLKDNICV